VSKPPPQPKPDPMAGVVDRLLSQLPGLQQGSQSGPARGPAIRPPQQAAGGNWQVRIASPTQGQIMGAWLRLGLALSLGIMMALWPYPRNCGLPLAGYLGAVACVLWAGGWAARASWRYRIALAHVLSLTVFLYGFTLTIAELLPRTGYALKPATWSCEAAGSAPALVFTQGTSLVDRR
jgi:hypothetical protein